MAIQFWKDMSILEGSLELAGHGKNINITVDCAPKDSTALNNTSGYVDLIGGLKTATVDLEFMQDVADDSVDETVWANFGTVDVVRSFCTASASGSVAFLMKGIALEYTAIEGNVGDLAMGRMKSMTSTGPLARGALLHPSNVNRTSSSTGAAVQLGAIVAGKRLYAALHVLSFSGSSPTLDVKVQSDDNSGFTSATDRITFAQAVGKTSELKSVAGAITDDYWRVSYTIGGSGSPTFAFAVTAGIY